MKINYINTFKTDIFDDDHMDKAYKIVTLPSEKDYSCLVILCNSNSPFDYINDIIRDVKGRMASTILIDQILHVGNTNKRFVALDYDGEKICGSSFALIKKGSSIRKATCDYLNKMDLVESSVLTSVQIRMIKKGVAI